MITHQQRVAAHQTRRGLRTAHRHRLAGPDALPGLLDAQHLAAGQRGHSAVDASSRRTRACAGYTSWRSEDQGQNLVTSLLIAVGTVVLTLLIAAPCAYALAQFRFRWISWALLAILISQMIPGIVIANALYTLYENIGLLNSIPG